MIGIPGKRGIDAFEGFYIKKIKIRWVEKISYEEEQKIVEEQRQLWKCF